MDRAEALALLDLDPAATPAQQLAAYEQRRVALEQAQRQRRTLKGRSQGVAQLDRLRQAWTIAQGRGGKVPPQSRQASPEAPQRPAAPYPPQRGQTVPWRRLIATAVAFFVCAVVFYGFGKSSGYRRASFERVQQAPSQTYELANAQTALRKAEDARQAAEQRAATAQADANRADQLRQQAENSLRSTQTQLAAEQQARRQAEAQTLQAQARRSTPAPVANPTPMATPSPAAIIVTETPSSPPPILPSPPAPKPGPGSAIQASPIAEPNAQTFVSNHFAAFLKGDMPAMLADYAPRVTFDGKADQTHGDITASRQIIYDRWRGARSGRILHSRDFHLARSRLWQNLYCSLHLGIPV